MRKRECFDYRILADSRDPNQIDDNVAEVHQARMVS